MVWGGDDKISSTTFKIKHGLGKRKRTQITEIQWP